MRLEFRLKDLLGSMTKVVAAEFRQQGDDWYYVLLTCNGVQALSREGTPVCVRSRSDQILHSSATSNMPTFPAALRGVRGSSS